MTDIFRFWAQVGPTDHVHPADCEVLSRVNHHFDLKCLPGCFTGPLRTAAIVLLYLSPGLSKQDRTKAKSLTEQERQMRVRRGREPYQSGGTWLRDRTKCFGDWDRLRSRIAVLNIGAYHSKNFHDTPLLAALPSSRVSTAWAQDVLFPQAIAGKRIVICLRSARFWGLEVGRKYGRSLFAPHVTRAGHMKHSEMRKQIIEAVGTVTNDRQSTK